MAGQCFELLQDIVNPHRIAFLSGKLLQLSLSLCAGTLGSMQNYLRAAQSHPN